MSEQLGNMVEHPKSKSTQPRFARRCAPKSPSSTDCAAAARDRPARAALPLQPAAVPVARLPLRRHLLRPREAHRALPQRRHRRPPPPRRPRLQAGSLFSYSYTHILRCPRHFVRGCGTGTSTFWVVTQPLPRAELATIPPMKEEMQGFHMTPRNKIFISEISLLNHLYTFKPVAPGIS